MFRANRVTTIDHSVYSMTGELNFAFLINRQQVLMRRPVCPVSAAQCAVKYKGSRSYDLSASTQQILLQYSDIFLQLKRVIGANQEPKNILCGFNSFQIHNEVEIL